MVAATIRKIQAKNQLAAVFEVSGSPLENLPYYYDFCKLFMIK